MTARRLRRGQLVTTRCFSCQSTRHTILGCDELTVWRVDWHPRLCRLHCPGVVLACFSQGEVAMRIACADRSQDRSSHGPKWPRTEVAAYRKLGTQLFAGITHIIYPTKFHSFVGSYDQGKTKAYGLTLHNERVVQYTCTYSNLLMLVNFVQLMNNNNNTL